MKKIRFDLTLKSGTETVAFIRGHVIHALYSLTVHDVANKIMAVEYNVEKLTGLRCHVETEYVEVEES